MKIDKNLMSTHCLRQCRCNGLSSFATFIAIVIFSVWYLFLSIFLGLCVVERIPKLGRNLKIFLQRGWFENAIPSREPSYLMNANSLRIFTPTEAKKKKKKNYYIDLAVHKCEVPDIRKKCAFSKMALQVAFC